MSQGMDELGTQLDEENQVLNAAKEFVVGQLNEVDGPMMQQLNFIGKSNTREGVAEMQKAENEAKQAETDSLNANEEQLTEGLSGKASRRQQALQQLGANGINLLQQTTSEMQQEIRDAETQAQTSGLSAVKSTQDFESATRDMQRLAAELALKANTLQQKSQQNEHRLQEKAQSLNEGILNEAQQNLDAAEHQISAQNRKRELELQKMLDAVAKGSDGVIH